MKRKLHIFISAILFFLAVLVAGTSGDSLVSLRGRAITYESRKPEAAKKKKNKKNKSSKNNSNYTDASGNTKTENTDDTGKSSNSGATVTEDGTYTSKDEVAAYIHQFGHLPSNFITKKEAKALGWVSNEGNLGEVAPGKSIGGDYFGNYEGQLPEAKGRSYTECDIDSTGGYRGAKRIIFSNDGLIFYTEDHYNTFEQLY